MFFHWYRRALRGDKEISRFLVNMAMGYLKCGNRPPPGLYRYYKKMVDQPRLYAHLMKEHIVRRRGRPSADAKAKLASAIPDNVFKRFFGTTPTEKNALMMQYLISVGHPINEAGKYKESASVLISAVTGRCCRAIQNDHYVHRDRINKSPGSLSLGEALYEGRQVIATLKARSKQ